MTGNLKLPADQRAIRGLSLQIKMFFLFGGVCGLIIIGLTLVKVWGLPFVGVDGTYQSRMSLSQKNVVLIADYKKAMIENWLSERRADLEVLAGYRVMIQNLFVEGHEESARTHFEKHLQDVINANIALSSIRLVNTATGEVLASTSQASNNPLQIDLLQSFQTSPDGFVVRIMHGKDHRDCGILFGKAIPFGNAKKQRIALFAKADIKVFLQPVLHNIQGLGQSGEIVLVSQKKVLLSQLKNRLKGEAIGTPLKTILTGSAADQLAQGSEAVIVGQDYRGIKSVAATRIIDIGEKNHWGIIVKQDYSEIMHMIHQRIYSLILGGVFGALLLLGAVYLLAHRITRPLKSLTLAATAVSEGDLTARAKIETHDELGVFADIFNTMVDQIAGWHDELNKAVAEKTENLSSAYQSLQQVEARLSTINEITSNYLSNGDLNRALSQLVGSAMKFTDAGMGCFITCSTENGEIKVKDISELYWNEPSASVEKDQVQEAFNGYAQKILQSTGRLLTSTLEHNQIMIFDAEEFVLGRSIPFPAELPAIESLMLVPVSIAGEIFGVFALVNSSDEFNADSKSSVAPFATEAALLIYAENREIARAAAEETTRIRSAFMANMSHELRTPLNIIIGMNQLLAEMKNSQVQNDYLGKIGFSAKQLLLLINDVLDLSKITAGKALVLDATPFEPEELFYNIAQLLAYRQDDLKVELHADVSREIPSRLVGDVRRLTQILNNLLSNAIKFTQQGTVILKVVLVEKTETEAILGFSVTDTGIGMSESQLGEIFQPFVQLDSSSTRQHDGSGLGLAISRELCQLMGGDLSVESRLNLGSTFTFELPFPIDPDADQEMKELIPTIELHGMPVLLATDCPLCSKIIKEMLESMRFRVDSIESDRGAKKLINSAVEQGDPYQLLLIGQSLKEMSGLEFVEKLATDQDFSEIRRLLLANPADIMEISKRAETLALDGLLSNPVRPSQLYDAILTALGHFIAPDGAGAQLSIRWQAKVLLVEDNEMGRQMARGLLENMGIEVVEAQDGAEAVNRVQSEDFDLVLMDIQMPVMDGLSAARAIRKLDKDNIENLPIIALTAHAFTEHRAESLDAGMNGHVSKPILLEALYHELGQWLPKDKLNLVREINPAADSDNSDLEMALPGIDIEAGIRRSVGKREIYLSMLKKFTEQFADTERELDKELVAGQQKDALRRVHTLKGVAGNLGAVQLQQLAGQLEGQLTRQEDPAAMSEMLTEHKRFLTALQNLPELNSEVLDGGKQSGTESDLQDILKGLVVPLETLQAQAAKSFLTQLKQKNWPDTYSDKLDQLDKMIEGYQFNKATELLQTLLQDRES